MKPISFNTEMVRAILDGRKTQTRRLIKPQPRHSFNYHGNMTWSNLDSEQVANHCAGEWFMPKPQYQPGDILWVREKARLNNYTWGDDRRYDEVCFDYEADNSLGEWIKFPERIKFIKVGHCCPNGCFKELARIFLKVTNMKTPERFRDITEADAIAEGVCRTGGGRYWIAAFDSGFKPRDTAKEAFHDLIESVYPGQWNNWCFPYEFEREAKK